MEEPKIIHPHLRALADHTRSFEAEVTALLDRPSGDLQWKPDESSWNAFEVAEHVWIMNEAYLQALDEAMLRADQTDETERFRPGLFARLFISLVSPDPKFKVKTIAATTPAPGSADRNSIRGLADQQDRLLDVISKADGVNLNATRLTSPFSSLIRFTIGEALTVIVMHQLRHMQQIRRLLTKTR